jgi:REP element-mobilizing transposase RayT
VPQPFAGFAKGGGFGSLPVFPSSLFELRFPLMPKNLKRRYGTTNLHFITFCCYRRLPFLRTAHARNVFLIVLHDVRQRYQFAIVGYVVMPEHVHLLLSEPKKGNPSLVV